MARRPANGMESESLWRQEIERRLRALESNPPGGFSSDGVTTFLRADRDLEVTGGDIVIDGGELVAGPTTVDATGVVIAGAPVTLDADGLDIGNGLTVIDSSGVQVGSDVVIDSTGLYVDGGLVQAVWAHVDSSLAQNASLTTSHSLQNSFTVNPPDWVEQVLVEATVVGQFTNGSGGNQSVITRATIDSGGAQEDVGGSRQQYAPAGQTASVSDTHTHNFALSPAGRSFVITQTAQVSVGTNNSNAFRLNIRVTGFRSAFT